MCNQYLVFGKALQLQASVKLAFSILLRHNIGSWLHHFPIFSYISTVYKNRNMSRSKVQIPDAFLAQDSSKMSKGISIFISGANRGLGLEMVRQSLAKFSPKHVFATYRDGASAKELQKIASENPNVHLLQLDIKDHTKFDGVAKQVDKITNGAGLNLLVNNAGIYSDDGQGFFEITKETLMNYLEINTVGNVLMTQAFFPLLEKAGKLASTKSIPAGVQSAVVINITSSFASIGNNADGGYYASRCSRSALNAMTKNMSVEFIPKNVMAVALSPGWVQTDQGGPNAPLKPKESVEGMLNVIGKLTKSDNGKFLQYDGKELPW